MTPTLRNLTSLMAFAVLAVAITACSTPAKADANDATAMSKTTDTRETVPQVTVANVLHGTFESELVSNGRLEAGESALVPLTVSEMITRVDVQEGQRVDKGQLLGQLESFNLQRRLDNAQNAFDKAVMDLEDQLVSMGYDAADTSRIPANMMKMARIRSGYNSAATALSEARRNLSLATITAPIGGVVSNLEAKANNPASAFKSFCTIIGNRTMQVSFQLLESEMTHLSPGQQVAVQPFALSGRSFTGTVTAVNPTIDASGMVKVTATLPNDAGVLMDGMNAKIVVKKSLPDCLVIPKTAVIYRQNRKVVFVHQNGKAIWTYVETGLENTTSVTITSGLEARQEVIVSNNADLAHESPVTVGREQ
ncbi:RND family efflux transporter MFP subunit [Breznakibacter xylanolyticus]|uniref:RND family efflux transporter MFP subunit n=2 Tax=Breznakibacter xylanolyticus TaxID=990 RepID=A0A2W7PKX8_9BACT|nr:efflux RND transporter periplasmic adaptor subunit [Breznakibacter xylanolyticus]PZX09949.1 RND family efflux transporter MFP subunit [Breznakibacter xylanolyticus]